MAVPRDAFERPLVVETNVLGTVDFVPIGPFCAQPSSKRLAEMPLIAICSDRWRRTSNSFGFGGQNASVILTRELM